MEDPKATTTADPRQTTQTRSGDIRSLLPPDWGVVTREGHALLTCYRLVIRGELRDVHRHDILGSRILAFWGSLPHTKTRSNEILEWKDGDIRFHIDAEETTTVEGNYLVCVTPLSPNADRGIAEREARERSRAAVGAVMLQLGENSAYSQVFENLLGPDGKGTFTLGELRVTCLFPILEADEMLAQLKHITDTVAVAPIPSWERIAHALRWLSVGMARDDTDAFLSMWIALEILVMRGSTDIRPINERLAEQYDVTYREACEKFLVGRLFGIRSRIVHHGAVVEVNANIRLLMRSVFYDCLHQEVGRKSRAVADVIAATEVAKQIDELSAKLATRSEMFAAKCPCGSGALFRGCHGVDDEST